LELELGAFNDVPTVQFLARPAHTDNANIDRFHRFNPTFTLEK
jgi:hypothetical protein